MTPTKYARLNVKYRLEAKRFKCRRSKVPQVPFSKRSAKGLSPAGASYRYVLRLHSSIPCPGRGSAASQVGTHHLRVQAGTHPRLSTVDPFAHACQHL